MSTGKLLDAAAELIALGGYERMTLTAIGKRAGYSHGLVTARFGSKEGLLWALVDRMVNTWRVELLQPAVSDQAACQALHTMIDKMAESWRRSPERMKALYILMFEALLPVPLLHDRMAELHRDMRQSVNEVIERSVAEGSTVATVPPEVAGRLIVGALRGAIYQSMLDPENIPVPTALADVAALIDSLLVDRSADPD
jgi:AcrR family transcriptional regulator